MGIRKKLRTRCSPKLSPWKILIFIVILKVSVMSLFTWKLLKVGNDEPLTKNTKEPTRLQPNIQNATQVPEEDESAGRILDSETLRIQQGQSCIFPTMTPWNSMLRAMYSKNKPFTFPMFEVGKKLGGNRYGEVENYCPWC